MTGCLPFTDDQARAISAALRSRRSQRDRALFVLGVTTGFRITELLSLSVGDVRLPGGWADSVHVERRHTKKRVAGRTKSLVSVARAALADYLDRERPAAEPAEPLFLNVRSGRAITRQMAWHTISTTAWRLGIGGMRGTHSMRKTYARRTYEATDGDYMRVKMALGHRSVASTESYLQFIEAGDVDDRLEWDL